MTPLPQALREADEALTGTLLAKMQDVEAARATVRLKKAAQDLLAALDASATTGRETPAVSADELDAIWRHIEMGWSIEPRAYFESAEQRRVGFGHPLIHAIHHMWKRKLREEPRRAETPTPREAFKAGFNANPAPKSSVGWDFSGIIAGDMEPAAWDAYQRWLVLREVAAPSPARPEGPRDAAPDHVVDVTTMVRPRDAAPELFAAGWKSGYNDGFIHCCEMNEKQHPIKAPSVQGAWRVYNLPEPEVIHRPVSADGAPGGEK